MHEIKLGQLIADNKEEERDAIHIAIAPVIAGEDLLCGAHVSVEDGTAWACKGKYLGIVDPFLKRTVRKGQKCFVLLYPNTITSLKHHWVHPSFDLLPTPQDAIKLIAERRLRVEAEKFGIS